MFRLWTPMLAMVRARSVPAILLVVCGAMLAHGATEEAEVAVCQRNLRLIGDALERYRHNHNHEVPNWLSDLVPNYLSVEFLTCPTSRRKGVTSVGATGRRQETDPRLPTSYFYEFSPKVFDDPRLARMTNREWKQRQMEVIGPVVPIVRCLYLHRTNLNLAYDARIYESGLYWESNFAHQVSANDLYFATDWVSDGARRVVTVLPRSAESTPLQLDLAADFNGSLHEAWWPRIRGASLKDLPAGWQLFGGVQFEVRGVLQLFSNPGEFRRFPNLIRGIAVGQSVRRFHLLLGICGAVPLDSEVARFGLNFSGRTRPVSVPIVYGRDVMEAWPGRATAAEVGAAKLAWQTPVRVVGAGRRPTRIYQMSVENPVPATPVLSVDFTARGTNSAPFLLAITIEP